MHLAKGLEFRAVIVMACDDEIIPSQEGKHSKRKRLVHGKPTVMVMVHSINVARAFDSVML